MTALRRDPLAHWRKVLAERAAEAGRTVSSVSTPFPGVETPGNAQETTIVATVSSVSTGNAKGAGKNTSCDARCMGAPDNAGMDHDAADRAAMVAHYAEEGAARPYQPGDPDALRDGLAEGFRRHHGRAAP